MDSEQDQPLSMNIEVEDLRQLANINPLAWEQLLHIVDNRINAEKIAELEGHLAHAHDSIPIEHRVVTKSELDRVETNNGATQASLG